MLVAAEVALAACKPACQPVPAAHIAAAAGPDTTQGTGKTNYRILLLPLLSCARGIAIVKPRNRALVCVAQASNAWHRCARLCMDIAWILWLSATQWQSYRSTLTSGLTVAGLSQGPARWLPAHTHPLHGERDTSGRARSARRESLQHAIPAAAHTHSHRSPPPAGPIGSGPMTP